MSREGGEVVALDLAMDDELRERGLARDVVRQVQDLRKTSGLEVTDRIRLYLVGLDSLAEHFDFIAREVLAVEVLTGPVRGRARCSSSTTTPSPSRCGSGCKRWTGPGP